MHACTYHTHNTHNDACVFTQSMSCLEMYCDVFVFNLLAKCVVLPLVTLLSSEAEVQFVALRNINLIVQKR